jgi:predicted lipid-binding transport protein (Tim44 family)
MHTPLATSTTTTQSSSTPTGSNDNSSQPVSSEPASSGLSGGAIAGIVVGCLAGGFLLACIFFFRKRIAAAFSGKGEPEAQYYDPSYSGGHPQPQIPRAVSEMLSERAPVELQGAHIVRELDGFNSKPKHYA